jgi:hypothetical protein
MGSYKQITISRYFPFNIVHVSHTIGVLETCLYRSGSGYPYQWITKPDPVPDPDPALFVRDFQDTNKFLSSIFCLLLTEGK